MIRHYRVDKMLDISVSDEARQGEREFGEFDVAKYSKQLFDMFSGEEVRVTMRCEKQFAGVFLDRFGTDVFMAPDGEDHFTVTVGVALSGQFLGWVISLGEGVQVTGPETVIRRLREEGARLSRQYADG